VAGRRAADVTVVEPVFIGIDLGTSACKVIGVSGEGQVVAKELGEYPTVTSRPGWAEQSPDDWWRAADGAVAAVASSLPPDARVEGIGLCGQMHGLTALDAEGEVLRPAILWNDQRAAPQCDWITDRAGGLPGLLELTKNRMLPGFTGGKVVWLRDNEPDLYGQMRRLLNPKDYLRLRMTGEHVTDVSDASGTGLFDVGARRWSTELLELIDVSPELLPDVVESIEQTGGLLDAVASRWGLPVGTPVFGGGGDAVVQTTSMGLIDPGPVGVILGTAGNVAGGTDACPENPDGRVQVSCGNAPGRWHVMGVTLAAGGALQWLRDLLAPIAGAEHIDYGRLIELARDAPPGSEGLLFLPYLLGERSPHVAPEATAAWVGLTPLHGAPHLVRSVIEGVLLNVREILDVCVRAGLECTRVVASGGATNDELWLTTLADVFGRDVSTMAGAGEGGAYGAAMVAGVGAGHWPSLEDAAGNVREARRFQPDPGRAARYERIFQAHRGLYGHLREAHADVAVAQGA
jgi:xylulokinase